MFICLRIRFDDEAGADYTVPRIIPVKDIERIEPHQSNPDLSYAKINNLPENPPGVDDDFIVEHSLEELAHALGCDTAHMKGDFKIAGGQPKLDRQTSSPDLQP